MKKALSLFLAVLMICGCMAIGASAEVIQDPTNWFGEAGSGKPATYEQVICTFDTNAGTIQGSVRTWSPDEGYGSASNFSGIWAMVPTTPDTTSMTPGDRITLPTVTPPANQQFGGWYCYEDGQTYAGTWTIPATINGHSTAGSVIRFRASYTPATIEEPTMTKVLGVLAKVFGALIGILLYKGDTAAGVELVERMLSGVIG